MLEGVKILLERMKTHPEEFFSDSLKWHWTFLDSVKRCLTQEEKDALQAGLDEVAKHEFTAKVMETLLADETKVQYREVMRLDSSGNLGIGATSPSTYTASSSSFKFYDQNKVNTLTIGATGLTESDFKRLKSLADREAEMGKKSK